MSLTISDIQSLQRAGKIRGFKVSVGAEQNTAAFTPGLAKVAQKEPIGLMHIKRVLEKRGIRYVEEYQAIKTRKFRADIAILNLRIIVEYEGLVATGKKGGHQTKHGYTSNCTKYNAISIEGWTLLRYTFLNYLDFQHDLITILINRNER